MDERKDPRSKLWEVIFYPDSAPAYWPDIINDLHISAAVSPCHNMDKWTAKDEAQNPEHKQGFYKKPHFHLLLHYDGNKSMQQVINSVCIPLNGNQHPKICESARNTTRYLIHLDNPDKAPYRMDEIRFFNGFDCKDYFELSEDEVDVMCSSIERFIYDEKIVEYSDLCYKFLDLDYMPWLKYVRQHSVHFNYLLKSLNHSGFFVKGSQADERS